MRSTMSASRSRSTANASATINASQIGRRGLLVGCERLSRLTKPFGDGGQRLLHLQRTVVPLPPRSCIRTARGPLPRPQHLLGFGVEVAQTCLQMLSAGSQRLTRGPQDRRVHIQDTAIAAPTHRANATGLTACPQFTRLTSRQSQQPAETRYRAATRTVTGWGRFRPSSPRPTAPVRPSRSSPG